MSSMPFYQAGQHTAVNVEEHRGWAHVFFQFQYFRLDSVGSFFFPPWGEIMQRCP